MAFPINPTDGQIFANYVYDANTGTWGQNKWRPLYNFGSNTRFTGVTGINSAANLTAAGITMYATNYNTAVYSPSAEYLTWFYTSTPNGTMLITLPSWATKYYIRYGCTSGTAKLQHLISSSWVDQDSVSQPTGTGEGLPEIHHDYYSDVPASKQIKLWEQGVASTWWVFIQ